MAKVRSNMSAVWLTFGCSMLSLSPVTALARSDTASAATLAPPQRQAAAPPNILVILADDLGYGEVGFQGYAKDIPTPNLDSIAANGMRFTNGYVSGPYCSPTRAGFLTGRYQERTGHDFNPNQNTRARYGDAPGLALSERTIGDRLKAAGYVTGWFGKSHQGYTPEQNPTWRGFDEFYGFLSAAHSYVQLGQGANDVNAILRGTEPVRPGGPGSEPFYTTDAFGRETVSFIERNKDRPWFAYLAFNALHTPLQAPAKYMSRFAASPIPSAGPSPRCYRRSTTMSVACSPSCASRGRKTTR